MLLMVLAAFVAALTAPLIHRFNSRLSGIFSALVPLFFFVFLISQIIPVKSGIIIQEVYSWIPSLGVDISFRMDGLGLLFALLICGIGVLVIVYASAYLRDHHHLGRFYGFILAFMAAMLGSVLGGDLITIFVFWELTGFCSYLLIGFDHENEKSRKAALQALLVTGGGGLALLAGFIMLGRIAGSMDLAVILGSGELVRGDELYLPVLVLVLLGAFTKSAQFPFHFWLPNAMAAPTPVSAYLHSATMVKLGIYLLARLTPVLGGTDSWHYGVTLTGGATMLIGALLALLSDDLKQILAYTTVSALGTLTLLLGLDTPASATAAIFFLMAHALYKSSLFLVAGAIDHGTGTRQLPLLGGLAGAMPWIALSAALAALSMAGVPPLAGFISKELVYEAKLQAPAAAGLVTGIGFTANALTVSAAVLVGFIPFFRKRPTPQLHHTVEPLLWLPPLLPAIFGAATGIFPSPAGSFLVAPAVAAVRGEIVPVDLALWHGINPVFLLGVATVASGIIVAFLRIGPLRSISGNSGKSWWGPERGYQLLLDGMLTLSRWQTRLLQNGRLRFYLMTVIGTAVCVMVIAIIKIGILPQNIPRPDGRLHEWLAAAVILAGAIATTITTSRLAAVAALGTVGYGVSLVYILYGAPDLAITQFCIETLSIVLFILVLYRLPRFSLLSSPAGRVRDLLAAITIGGLMTMLVLLAVSQTLVPHISSYFLEQSMPLAHGRNVVNVILVDFRALDTLGEITVLAVAALGVYGLTKSRRKERE